MQTSERLRAGQQSDKCHTTPEFAQRSPLLLEFAAPEPCELIVYMI
jgi:hypothetical protein